MKNTFFALITLFVLLSSCNSNEKPNTGGLLPDATGGADELLVFMEDAFVTDSLVQNIRKEMTDMYKILPQSEVRFSITAVQYSKMNTILERFRNPIFVITKNETSSLYKEMLTKLTDSEKQTLQNQKDAVFFKNNLTANKQNVAIVLAPNKKEILNTLLKYKKEMFNFFDENNLKFFKDVAYYDGVNKTLNKQFKKFHGLKFDVPKGYVTFTGIVPQDRSVEYLKQCDAFLCPTQPNKDGSPFFGSPTKLFEYMSMAKPIIASDLGQLSKVINSALKISGTTQMVPIHIDEEVGILVDPLDVKGFVNACKVCLYLPEVTQQKMGNNARQKVLKQYTWKQHVQRIVEFSGL